MRTKPSGPRPQRAPCRSMIHYETRRLQRQWSRQDFLHRRAIAAQRQFELAALLGLDTQAAKTAAVFWKRAERTGIRRLQRAEGQAVPTRASPCFVQLRRGGVLPERLMTRRGPDSRIRARREPPP
jgi:hypothetical protein